MARVSSPAPCLKTALNMKTYHSYITEDYDKAKVYFVSETRHYDDKGNVINREYRMEVGDKHHPLYPKFR